MSTETKKPKMRRSLRLVLIVSLTLNFLIVGVIVGGAVAHWGGRGADRPGSFNFASPYVRALEVGDRRSIGKAIRGYHRQRGPDWGVSTAQYRQAVELLRQSPLDVDALETLLERQRIANTDRQRAAQQIWVEHMTKLSDEDRAAYADRLETELNKRPRRGGPNRNH